MNGPRPQEPSTALDVFMTEPPAAGALSPPVGHMPAAAGALPLAASASVARPLKRALPVEDDSTNGAANAADVSSPASAGGYQRSRRAAKNGCVPPRGPCPGRPVGLSIRARRPHLAGSTKLRLTPVAPLVSSLPPVCCRPGDPTFLSRRSRVTTAASPPLRLPPPSLRPPSSPLTARRTTPPCPKTSSSFMPRRPASGCHRSLLSARRRAGRPRQQQQAAARRPTARQSQTAGAGPSADPRIARRATRRAKGRPSSTAETTCVPLPHQLEPELTG